MFTVLFLCTGNSARSILAEAILNHLAPSRFRAYSAGSHPKGRIHPSALDTLRYFQYPTQGLHSKSWEVVTGPEAPPLDCVITLCDDAAQEPCPLWPGHPVTLHWGLPDPAAVVGDADTTRLAFVETFQRLRRRLDALIQLPDATLQRLIQQQASHELAASTAAPDDC